MGILRENEIVFRPAERSKFGCGRTAGWTKFGWQLRSQLTSRPSCYRLGLPAFAESSWRPTQSMLSNGSMIEATVLLLPDIWRRLSNYYVVLNEPRLTSTHHVVQPTEARWANWAFCERVSVYIRQKLTTASSCWPLVAPGHPAPICRTCNKPPTTRLQRSRTARKLLPKQQRRSTL